MTIVSSLGEELCLRDERDAAFFLRAGRRGRHGRGDDPRIHGRGIIQQHDVGVRAAGACQGDTVLWPPAGSRRCVSVLGITRQRVWYMSISTRGSYLVEGSALSSTRRSAMSLECHSAKRELF
jgi:uncharacterized Zn-binding protein involved in type VI secretion